MDPDATFDPTPPAADPEGMPARIGPYRVDGLLGRGGMGEVYRGFDEALQRPVAIKRVAGRLRGQAEARARFWREARALATLDHPGVVRVHRIDESAEGELFLAMELVDGPRWPSWRVGPGRRPSPRRWAARRPPRWGPYTAPG
ncbi:MAG: protein kinase [bacterium]